jgi:N-acetyl-alpha-D-muramate 1-phosphate uridylyltransferase
MQTVILAGGLGTRIRSVAPDIPKSLIAVDGRPFIDHQFDLLRGFGFTRILLCIGHLGEMIVDHVGDGSAFGMEVGYSRDDTDRLLGTGGAIIRALPLLKDEFMVLYGDSYLPFDFSAASRAFRESGRDAMMTVFRNGGRWDSSNVRIEGNRVDFYSKSAKDDQADYIDYGSTFYLRSVFESRANSALPLDLSVIQESLVREGSLGAYEVFERFYEIGKPEGISELEAFLRKGKP